MCVRDCIHFNSLKLTFACAEAALISFLHNIFLIRTSPTRHTHHRRHLSLSS
jgi:hypothetical protein